ncbi:porin family protein [Oligoflexaceae bacterium]|nr:porin family protein [Oligoflexaceae bacterium]
MRILVLAALVFLPNIAHAELDPALADVSVDRLNPGGVFVKGLFAVGQSDPAGDSTPGVGYQVGGELGYGFSSGYWKRMEVGLELTTGQLEYKLKNDAGGAKVKVEVPVAMMVRFGLGSVMGKGGLLTWNVAVGNYLAKYSQTFNGQDFKASASSPSIAWRLGANFLMPMSEVLQFEAGFQHTQVTVNEDSLKVDGINIDADVSDIINIPQIMVGVRLAIPD